ncbi:MAG: hypothetical protein LBM27_03670 [Lactobacillaceae bacterium]|jgi:hypothetical protein|nr:hypothetical protein [Lactobacillaceae bacterium]
MIEQYVDMLKKSEDDYIRREELLHFIKDEFADNPIVLVPYVDYFATFLDSSRNLTRLITFYILRFIASIDPTKIHPYLEYFQKGMNDKNISVQDNSSFVLGYLGGQTNLDILISHSKTMVPNHAVAHADRFLQASNGYGFSELMEVLDQRQGEFSKNSLNRLNRIKVKFSQR